MGTLLLRLTGLRSSKGNRDRVVHIGPGSGSVLQLISFQDLNEKWPYSKPACGKTKSSTHINYTSLESNTFLTNLAELQPIDTILERCTPLYILAPRIKRHGYICGPDPVRTWARAAKWHTSGHMSHVHIGDCPSHPVWSVWPDIGVRRRIHSLIRSMIGYVDAFSFMAAT